MTIKDNLKRGLNMAKFYMKPGEIIKKMIQGYDNYPFSFREALEKYGDEYIQTLTITRTPLSKELMTALNVVTLGEMQKRVRDSPYDKLFHLALVINGKYTLEKNEKAVFRKGVSRGKGMESMDVPVNTRITIAQFIENTKKGLGDSKMLNYNAIYNNCQLFVSTALKSNGLLTAENNTFVTQDIASIFKGLNGSRKIVNTFTEIGNRANMFTEGSGLRVPKELLTLSSSQIISITKMLGIKLIGDRIYMKDEVTDNLKEGCYIMNLDSSDDAGTHWTCFIKDKKNIYYFDSFGQLPPEHEFQVFKDNHLYLYYSTQQNQHLDASSCGYWCIYWLCYMKKQKGTMSAKMKKFNQMFDKKNQKLNEKKLLKLYKELLI